MTDQEITMLLTTLLAISFAVLFVLIGVFFLITFNKKRKEREQAAKKIEEQKRNQEQNNNIIQTKVYSPKNVKTFLDFDEIKDNMIVQDNGKRLIMVIKCQGINYDLMSSIEKVSVEKGFVQFLNALTRPIQLYVQSRKVNLEESIQNYNKRLKTVESQYNKAKLQYEQAQKNTSLSNEKFNMIRLEFVRQKNLYEYTKDIISNTEKMSLNKNILTKEYYIATSYTPDNADGLFEKEELLDMAFSELYTNAQSLIRVLAVCGVNGSILDSMGLADLLYVAYNRDASEVFGAEKASRAGFDALYTTAPDVIDKKIEALDKMIEMRAKDLANSTIEDIAIKSKRRRELEEKEKNMKNIIKNMAKVIILDNEEYVGKEIAAEAIEELNKTEEETKTKKTRAKKGA